MTTSNIQIYVDLDGVLANFVAGVVRLMPSFVEGVTEADKKADREMWKAIGVHQKRGGQFWLELPLMDDATVLWDYIKDRTPQILSATGSPSFGADTQKHLWVAKMFGANVNVNLTQKSHEKALYAQPGHILIDDKMKSIDPWRQAGGTGILHTSAANTIAQLKDLGL